MADVFISYKRERRAAAEHLAETLGVYGYTCWFDYDLVKGEDFAQQIDNKIREAKALVVMWCTLSVGSRWVQEEADLGRDLGILIPSMIQACELPVGNRRLDFVDLTGWDGSPRSHSLDPLLDAIESKVGRGPHVNYRSLREYDRLWRRFGGLPLTSLALVEGPKSNLHAENGEDKGIEILHAIWLELRDSTDQKRLRRFWEQTSGTPIELLVEARLETLEKETHRDAADWFKLARPILAEVKSLYGSMGWSQRGPLPDGDAFTDALHSLVSSLPQLDAPALRADAAKMLNEYLVTTIHHGIPIPDDYRITPILPVDWKRPGLAVSYYNREGFGDLFGGVRFGPPDPILRNGVFIEPVVT